MSRITTHVLDTSLGKPVAGLPVSLSIRDASGFRELSQGVTDSDGRLRELLPSYPLEAATYQLVFDVAGYFRAAARPSFFERVTLEFHVAEPSEHHHVPLLLSPFGYSTYRGS
jgi:5-hydroxyisourate hydrolase